MRWVRIGPCRKGQRIVVAVFRRLRAAGSDAAESRIGIGSRMIEVVGSGLPYRGNEMPCFLFWRSSSVSVSAVALTALCDLQLKKSLDGDFFRPVSILTEP